MESRLIPIPDDREEEFNSLFQKKMQEKCMELIEDKKQHEVILDITFKNVDTLYYMGVGYGANLSQVDLEKNDCFRSLLAMGLTKEKSRELLEKAIFITLTLVDEMINESRHLPIEEVPTYFASLTDGIYRLVTYPFSFFSYGAPLAHQPSESEVKPRTFDL